MAQLRLATLNLFNNEFGRWSEREPLVVEQLSALDPDVAVFQEVDKQSDQMQRIGKAINLSDGADRDPPYQVVAFDNPAAGSIKSLALATRLPVADVERTEIGSGDIALRVGINASGSTVDVCTTHLHFSPSREGGAIRARQAERLLEWTESSVARGRACLVAGDFNATPDGKTVALLKARFRSAYEAAHGNEPEVTHPTPLFRALDVQKAFGVPKLPEGGVAVDYIFLGEGVEVISCEVAFNTPHAEVPHLYPSDHFGLVADLRV